MGMIFAQGRSFNRPTDFGNSARITLKEDIRKSWYMYKTTDHTVFKPYPVFDDAGNPCPCREDGVYDEDNPSFLPQSMVIAPVATWCGLDGQLEFIDVCSDAGEFKDEFGETAATPFAYLMRLLRNMTTETQKTGSNGRDGKPIHQGAQKYVKYFRYASPSVISRGALIIDKGGYVVGRRVVPVKAAGAQDEDRKKGILVNCFLYIPQKSARTALFNRFNEPFSQEDEGAEITAENCYLKQMFNPGGCAIEFIRTAANDNDRRTAPFSVRATKKYAGDFAEVVHTSFMANKTSEYYDNLRRMFGQYQRVEDALNIMTSEQMVTTLLSHYPAEWVWAALVNTPFLELIPAGTRDSAEKQAMRDSDLMARVRITTVKPAPKPAPKVEPKPAPVFEDDEIPMGSPKEEPEEHDSFFDDEEEEKPVVATDDDDDFDNDSDDGDEIMARLSKKHGNSVDKE